MKCQFLILPQSQLIIESFVGEMDIPTYMEFKLKQIKHPDYDPHYNVITDLRWAGFLFPAAQLEELTEFFKANIRLDIDRKGCMLTIDPLQTAYSMVFQKQNDLHRVRYKVCTTLREVLIWLDYPMSEDDLRIVLGNIKQVLESSD